MNPIYGINFDINTINIVGLIESEKHYMTIEHFHFQKFIDHIKYTDPIILVSFSPLLFQKESYLKHVYQLFMKLVSFENLKYNVVETNNIPLFFEKKYETKGISKNYHISNWLVDFHKYNHF